MTRSADGTAIGYRTVGSGPGVVVVGGALRTAEDYLSLAATLAESCTVHVVDRRGRGASGPQGPRYSLRTEVDDLRAVLTETGARWAFGHSYGGLVVLETARTTSALERIVVYEPGVPCAPVPTAWMAPYRERLDAGDAYGAFAHFVRGSGGAPAVVAKLPHWYLRTALRVGLRGRAWRRIRPLLWANLAEHEQIAAQQGRSMSTAPSPSPPSCCAGARARPPAGPSSPCSSRSCRRPGSNPFPASTISAPKERPQRASADPLWPFSALSRPSPPGGDRGSRRVGVLRLSDPDGYLWKVTTAA